MFGYRVKLLFSHITLFNGIAWFYGITWLNISTLFGFNAFVNFFTMHGNIFGGIDSNTDLITLYT